METKIRAAPAAMSAPDRLKKDLATVETIIEYLEKDEKKDGEEQKKLGSDVIRAMKEGWEKEVEVKREKGEDVTKDEIEVVSMNPSLLIRGKDLRFVGRNRFEKLSISHYII